MIKEQELLNYERIAKAITYIKCNFQTQPTLEDLAREVHLSPFHFQKLFTDWAGTSPKKFLQFTTIQYAKTLLKEKQANLFDTAHLAGLSSTGRLHDMFVNIEGMSPAEYKNGAKKLTIHYSFATSLFGKIIIASTTKGICYMAFTDDELLAFQLLQTQFPNANFIEQFDSLQENALKLFANDWSNLKQVKLHLKGSEFQLKVWQSLLQIPLGELTSYGNLAKKIKQPNASRAVGNAIGSNPIAYLIPCHRVIQANGSIGEYMWGPTRKTAMIAWEASQLNEEI